MWLEIWGWTCASVGVALSVPQIIRLLRTHTSSGLSLIMWQINTAGGVAWGIHGLRAGWLNLILPNFAVGFLSGLVVYMIAADRKLNPFPVWGLVAVLAGALSAVEWFTTPEAFGIAIAIPIAFGFLTQTREIARTPDITGISLPFIAMSALVQLMWITWGIAKPDPSIIICATVLGTISIVNLVWLARRRRGIVTARP